MYAFGLGLKQSADGTFFSRVLSWVSTRLFKAGPHHERYALFTIYELSRSDSQQPQLPAGRCFAK